MGKTKQPEKLEVGIGKEAKPKILGENNIDKNKRKADELKCHRMIVFLIGRKVIFIKREADFLHKSVAVVQHSDAIKKRLEDKTYNHFVFK